MSLGKECACLFRPGSPPASAPHQAQADLEPEPQGTVVLTSLFPHLPDPGITGSHLQPAETGPTGICILAGTLGGSGDWVSLALQTRGSGPGEPQQERRSPFCTAPGFPRRAHMCQGQWSGVSLGVQGAWQVYRPCRCLQTWLFGGGWGRLLGGTRCPQGRPGASSSCSVSALASAQSGGRTDPGHLS